LFFDYGSNHSGSEAFSPLAPPTQRYSALNCHPTHCANDFASML
jgi:hypothetical protein